MNSSARNDDLDALARDAWSEQMDAYPTRATYVGDGRGDDRLDRDDDEAHEERRRGLEALKRRLEGMEPPPANTEAGLTWRVLDRSLRLELEGLSHRPWEWCVDQLFGLHLVVQNLMSVQPLGDEAALERLLSRLADVPRAFSDVVGNLRAGIIKGRVPPRLAVERVIRQLRHVASSDPKDTVFVQVPMTRAPSSLSEPARGRWEERLLDSTRGHVLPAYASYLAFFESEVLPASREAVGIGAIPGGAEEYAWRVREMTTTDLTPDEIHEIGREELDANRAEMSEIAESLGHSGSLRSFLNVMRDDPQFRLGSREAILERYRAICERMDGVLPTVFGRLPETGYEIRAVEPFREQDAPAAFYQRPPEDRSRKGVFYANTHEPSGWPTYDFEPLCFHEAVPGHHLQIALAQEIPGLPMVRKYGFFTAYIEGWAHYTERLADEMGMYSTPHDRIGMLSAQAWRAVRLIVDTGIHHLGWSRDQAIAEMRSIRSGPESDVMNEVDRYIIWPGQALSYKVGSRTITEIRERCRQTLGDRFDLRGFHDEVLVHGALPLTLLDEVMTRWADAR